MAHQAERCQETVSRDRSPTPFPQANRHGLRSYNPVLGEFFRCRYDYPNGSQGFYIAEQGEFHSPRRRTKLNYQ